MANELRIGYVEVTQGLQIHHNQLPLVAGKPTVVRVFPRLKDEGVIENVSAKLRHLDIGQEIAADNGPIRVDRDSAWRGDRRFSLEFTLDPNWYSLPAGAQDDARLAPLEAVLVVDGSETGITRRIEVAFHRRRDVKVRFVIVEFDGQRPAERVKLQTACNYLRGLFPANPVDITYERCDAEPFLQFDEVGEAGLDGAKLIRRLNQIHDPNADHVFGWTPVGSFVHNGRSDPVYMDGQGTASFGNDTDTDPPRSRWRRTLAHELGHNTHRGPIEGEHLEFDLNGLDHPSLYPSSDRYFPWQLQDDQFGFDVLGCDPLARVLMRKTADEAEMLYDVMVGGRLESDAWIGRHNYIRLFTSLEPQPPSAPGPPGPEHVIRIQTLIYQDRTGADEIFPYVLHWTEKLGEAVAATPTNRSGVAEVRLYRSDGAGGEEELVSRRVAWDPRFVDPEGNPESSDSKTWFLALPIEADRISLQFHGSEVASEQFPPIPKFRVTKPDLEVIDDGDAGAVLVEWDVEMPEGNIDIETQRIEYSAEDPWAQLRGFGGSARQQIIPISELPGGKLGGVFRVVVNDGQLDVVSDPAYIDTVPRARVVFPESGHLFEDRPPLLVGYGIDERGVRVSGDRLKWFAQLLETENAEGQTETELGTGEQLVWRDAEPGQYRILLRVDDVEETSDAIEEIRVRRTSYAALYESE